MKRASLLSHALYFTIMIPVVCPLRTRYALHVLLYDASRMWASVFMLIWRFEQWKCSRRGSSCLRLRDLSYISTYDDRCRLSRPVEALQYSMRAASAFAFAWDYCDNLVFLLLAPQASWWKASHKICSLRRTLQEPRWVAQASRISSSSLTAAHPWMRS